MGASNSKSNPKSGRNSNKRYGGHWTSWPPAAQRAFLAQTTRSLQTSERLIDWTAAFRMIGGQEFDFAEHEYLKGIYLEEGPAVVIRKAAQMGASEYAISRSIHFAATKGGKVIYFFPSDHDVTEFSQDRFGPAIEQSD